MSDLDPRSLTVPATLDGARLDLVLVELLEDVSRVRIQELIKDGGVRVAGAPAERASQPVEAGWTLELLDVVRSRVRTGGPPGPERELDVIHEDEHLVVLDKPAGMVAHPSSVVRGGTVSERMVERYGPLPSPQGEDRPGIVHRLDADTSGLLVVARSEEAAAGLMTAFQERTVDKHYLALVFHPPRFDSDWIETRIGRLPGRPDRMSVATEEGQGREASTYYETLERFRGFGYVRLKPETGRTHQLRVHLASIDHPLVGDRVYRGRRGLSRHMPKEAPAPTRHALHASELAFTHPVSGERLAFEVPLARDLQRFLDWLRAREASADES